MILKDRSLSWLQILAVHYKNRSLDQISLLKNCYSWLRQYIMVENTRRKKKQTKD